MSCACIRYFDFDITEPTCKSIIYIDRSSFQGSGGYTLTLIHPDGTKSNYEVSNIPLHIDLGTCVPAGVYEFTTSTCGETFSKKFPILCSLECGYLKASAKLGRGIEIESLRSIRERIDRIRELVSYGDIDSAVELTQSVERDLKKINCSCTC